MVVIYMLIAITNLHFHGINENKWLLLGVEVAGDVSLSSSSADFDLVADYGQIWLIWLMRP